MQEEKIVFVPLSEDDSRAAFGCGLNCTQQVFLRVAEALGVDRELAIRTASGFGGGMGHAETCGVVSGAVMAIGLCVGPSGEGDADGRARVKNMCAAFEKAFLTRNTSLRCKDLLGYDLSTPEGMAKLRELGRFGTICPRLVSGGTEILAELLS